MRSMVYVTVGCPSVRPSVCLIDRQQRGRAAGLLLSALRVRGVVGRGDGAPHFFRQGDASPTPPVFWTEIPAKVSPLLQLVTY